MKIFMLLLIFAGWSSACSSRESTKLEPVNPSSQILAGPGTTTYIAPKTLDTTPVKSLSEVAQLMQAWGECSIKDGRVRALSMEFNKNTGETGQQGVALRVTEEEDPTGPYAIDDCAAELGVEQKMSDFFKENPVPYKLHKKRLDDTFLCIEKTDPSLAEELKSQNPRNIDEINKLQYIGKSELGTIYNCLPKPEFLFFGDEAKRADLTRR